jgi:hypothetical protein
MSASIKSNSSGNLELFSGSTKVLEANATTGVVSGLKVAAGSAAGEAVNYDQVLGVGQTWQNVTASRTAGVTYTNSTGKPIVVSIRFGLGTNTTSINCGILVDGTIGVENNVYGETNPATRYTLNAIVPNGATYSTAGTPGRFSVGDWVELRG